MIPPHSKSQYRSIDNLTTRAPALSIAPPPTPTPTSRISSFITILLTQLSQYRRFLGVILLRIRDILRPYIITILFSSAFFRFAAIIRTSIRVRVSLRKSYPRVVCKVRV
ncbi:hypothetical protein ONZ45_g14214 [Pleurotus djamor]|nr:hypothetical protein ONZ45_g14214 [Pleurotus djamor]